MTTAPTFMKINKRVLMYSKKTGIKRHAQGKFNGIYVDLQFQMGFNPDRKIIF